MTKTTDLQPTTPIVTVSGRPDARPDARRNDRIGGRPIDGEPSAAPKLTDRQREILELIEETIATRGAPPTRAEIAKALGFRSANAAEDHLQALARKGAIELLGGTSRGIRLRAATSPAKAMGWQAGLPLAGLAQLCLPLIGRVAAGLPILAQEHVERTYSVEAHLFSSQPDYLLTVRGMSMCNAGIIDGDLLGVRKSATARDGQIVVARIGDEVTVKRLQREGGSIQLVPENESFDVIHVAADDDSFALEGVAVGLIRRSM